MCVVYVAWQGQIVRTGYCLKSQSLSNQVLSSVCLCLSVCLSVCLSLGSRSSKLPTHLSWDDSMFSKPNNIEMTLSADCGGGTAQLLLVVRYTVHKKTTPV